MRGRQLASVGVSFCTYFSSRYCICPLPHSTAPFGFAPLPPAEIPFCFSLGNMTSIPLFLLQPPQKNHSGSHPPLEPPTRHSLAPSPELLHYTTSAVFWQPQSSLDVTNVDQSCLMKTTSAVFQIVSCEVQQSHLPEIHRHARTHTARLYTHTAGAAAPSYTANVMAVLC